MNRVLLGDCLTLMKELPDQSVDMILCDLPYGITEAKWDSVIPLDSLWEAYVRLIKPKGAVILTATQPFTTQLIQSNLSGFKYLWYWVKNRPTGFANAKIRPLKVVEDICVFNSGFYYPQGLSKINKPMKNSLSAGGFISPGVRKNPAYTQEFTGYPKNLLEFKSDIKAHHPNQKPVALFEYLIKTYTQEGDTVLDNCAGSGTTGIACINTKRNYILMEKEPSYVEIIQKRISDVRN